MRSTLWDVTLRANVNGHSEQRAWASFWRCRLSLNEGSGRSPPRSYGARPGAGVWKLVRANQLAEATIVPREKLGVPG
jgi:hypothetical protein